MMTDTVRETSATRARYSAAVKENLDAQQAFSAALANRASRCVAKFAELQIDAARTAMTDSAVAAGQLLSVTNLPDFFTFCTEQAQRSIAKILDHERQTAGIVSSLQGDFSNAAQVHAIDTGHRLRAMLERTDHES